MSKSMLINVTHPEESRVAIVENGTLDGFEIETIQHGQLKGNVYKGIVRNVNTALQAAFVEFGASRDGFLPLDEVNYRVLPARQGKQKGKGHRIEDHLKSGLKVVVQVVKDGFGSKPPTLSTFISLPGRFLVLTPDSDAGGVSRKIADQKQRERLRKILSELKTPDGAGVIVRTAGTDQTKTELSRDLRYLVRLWQNIEAAAKKYPAPVLLYRERDLAIRTIRDYLTSDIKEIWIDDEAVFLRAEHWFKAVMPTKRKILKQYQGAAPLFSKHNIEDQIEQIFRRRVNLPSGGGLVIDSTEALTAVDVNSGKYRKGGSLEDTATQTNLEAAAEIARQLRLRDLGGIIVIDFIDMRSRRNIRSVEKVVRDSMKADKARHDVTSISKLGLMEISRQRLKPTKTASTFVDCETCGGDGRLRAVESAALSTLRKIHTHVARGNLDSLRVRMPDTVAIHLLNQKREELGELEARHRCRIIIDIDPTRKRDEAEFEPVRRDAPPQRGARRSEEARPDESDAKRRRRRGGRAEKKPASPASPASDEEETAAVSEEDVLEGLDAQVRERDDEESGTRKRRRRGGRERKKPAAAAEAEAGETAESPEVESEEGEDATAAGTRKRRRRRRGGRGRRGRGKAAADGAGSGPGEAESPPAEDAEVPGEDADVPTVAPPPATPPPTPAVEILVSPASGEGEPYVPPSIAGRPQEAPDQPDDADRGSWWSRFRRALRTEDE